MIDNYIFSGIGFAAGKYQITNKELEEALDRGYLDGFNEARVAKSENFKKLKKKKRDLTAFEYMAHIKMGFRTRNHVVPFPVTEDKIKKFENGTHLAVQALVKAFNDSGIHPEEIDLWLGSTGTPHEQAPGIASTVKCFFTNEDNQSSTATINSACVGFNINLQRGIEFLKTKPNAKHVAIFHTETLSHLLTRRTNFVNFTTFGDGAACVILTKIESKRKEGVVAITNHEDLTMIDHLGSDIDWNLYMSPQIVRARATANIVKRGKEVLKMADWNIKDIDYLIPHQTGNAIVLPSTAKLKIPKSKLVQEVQYTYGNISGASVPASIYLLKQQKKLKSRAKLVCPVCGLGGENGAFAYIVPSHIKRRKLDISEDLKGKQALLTGSTGGIGEKIAEELAKRGCNLILQYHSNHKKAHRIKKRLERYKIHVELVPADFSDIYEVYKLIDHVKSNHQSIDYLIHASAISGGLSKASQVDFEHMKKVMQVNQFSPIELTKGLKNLINKTVIYIGSVAEDAQFSGSSTYVQSKKGMHGFAGSFAGELNSLGIRSVYYMPGTVSAGMAGQLSKDQMEQAMINTNQSKTVSASEIAERIVKSLYILKVLDVSDSYEGLMLVRRDVYKWNEK